MECSPTTYVLAPPFSCACLLLSPGSLSHLSEFYLWSSCSVDCTPASFPHRASKLSSWGQVGRRMSTSFSSVFLEDLPWLCLRLHFTPRTSTLRGSCVTKALGTVASTHPAQRGCALTFLVPPVPKTRLQNCILGSATSWPPSPPLLPRAGALTISSREGQLLIWGVKQGAKANQPPGPGPGGEAEEARDVGEAPCHPLSPRP